MPARVLLHLYAPEPIRELWRIDENLIRAELTEIERGEHLKRRREIFEARKNTGENLPSIQKGRGQPKQFDQDTADKTGMSKSAVQKSRVRAEKIIPEVKEAIKDIPLLERAGPAFGETGPGMIGWIKVCRDTL